MVGWRFLGGLVYFPKRWINRIGWIPIRIGFIWPGWEFGEGNLLERPFTRSFGGRLAFQFISSIFSNIWGQLSALGE